MRTFIADRGQGEPISLGAALLAGKKVGPDVTNLLMEDHRSVLGWFSWYRSSDDPEARQRVAARICAALRAHMAGEEEILYAAAHVLGRGDLIERALAEHEGGKRLMERIAAAEAGSEEHARLVAELEAEIRNHVDEEESELFPALRESTLDPYAVGRSVAARRVDRLFEERPQSSGSRAQKEYPNMQISRDEARDAFVLGLRNAHAVARQARSMASAQVQRLEEYPDLKARFDRHTGEKDAQLSRLEKILERCGESPSMLKDAAGSAVAGVTALASATADDEVIKNGFTALALARYEAAAFETLILFGEAAGELEALPPLQESLSEQRGLAAWLEQNLRPTGMRYLQLRSRGADASH